MADPPVEGSNAQSTDKIDGLVVSSEGYLLTRAYQEARSERPDLTDGEFVVLANQAFPHLSGHWGSAPAEILAFVNALRPPRRRRRSPTGSPGRPRLNEAVLRRELERALAVLAEEGEDRPTRELLAERLGVDPSTLRYRLKRFPALKALLPSSGRPRRYKRE